jgi:hypothetical protein
VYYHIKCPITRVEAAGGERKFKEIAKKVYKVLMLIRIQIPPKTTNNRSINCFSTILASFLLVL